LKRPCALILLILGAAASLSGEVFFSNLHLSKDNRLLFQATADIPGHDEFRTLFLTDVKSGSIRQMTFFPEELRFLPQTGQVQIQNRFGVFRTDKDLANPSPISRFPSFVTGKQVQTGKIAPIQASPDGRFLLYLEPASSAYGDLVLLDIVSGKTEIVSKQVELSVSGPMAEWSPNSQFFIYAKTGRLFYFSLDQFLNGRLVGESYRSIGEGGMSSVRWGRNGDLYYLSGTLVFRIMGIELFTRTLYQNLIRIGRIAGKIPYEFDPNFDSFWISPDGAKMLLNVGGRNVFLYYLQADDFLSIGKNLSLPYLFLPRNTMIRSVAWSKDDMITILAAGLSGGGEVSSVFRLDLGAKATAFTKTDETAVTRIELSPDETKAALLDSASVVFRDYRTWNALKTVGYEKPVHAVWTKENELVVGGSWLVQSVSADTGELKFICFSQPEEYGFKGNEIQIRTRNVMRRAEGQSQTLSALPAFEPEPAEVATGVYRVYLEPLASGSYRNLVMVRKVQSPGTNPLFTPPAVQYEPFPEKDEAPDTVSFSHGSRIRSREVAFTFDAIDSVEGLTRILHTLSEYKIRATFFVNGDFIRRNPGAVKEIADSGHEVGSLFYTYFNMTDPQFQITPEFIKQGLARNEDDYFAVTGKELSLLWHAPYHFVSSDIVKASKDMNYVYVGRDVDSLDWVVKRDDSGLSRLYFPSADLVERILKQKKPGSIISMRIGKPGDSKVGSWRDDYLFQKLDLLVNLLVSRGYRIVPVSVLLDRSR